MINKKSIIIDFHDHLIYTGAYLLTRFDFLNSWIVEIHWEAVKFSAPSTLTELSLKSGAPGTKFIPTVYFQ